MKERIKELALQAGLIYIMTPDKPFIEEDLEKFAELIVRECVEEIEFQYGGGRELDDGTHSPDWDKAVECISAMVRAHFGIK